MTDTSQEIPGVLPGCRSEWQSGRQERLPKTKPTLTVKEFAVKRTTMIENVYGGIAGQLSDAAHHLSSRGT